MSNPILIMQQIESAKLALQKGNDELKTIGVKKANAEMNYKVALRKELLNLRLNEKQPVAIIQDLAKGQPTISKLRLDRDLQENAYSVCLEAMRNTRIEIDTLRSFLVWERTELNNS